MEAQRPRDGAPLGPIDSVEERDLSGEVRLVRLRLGLVVVATTIIALVAGAAVGAIVAPDPEHRLGAAIHAAPLPWLAACVLAFAGACNLTILLARRVIEPAQKLDTARRRYGALYASAQSRALEDSLTELGNHRAFQEEFDRQLELSRRHGVAVALVLLDLDDFKLINDSAGHPVGDEVLVETSRLLRAGIRQSDRAFRIGGDEFAVVMPHTTVEEAGLVARRLLAAAVAARPTSAFPRGFSFSAGVTGAPELGSTRSALFDQADAALYAGKREGRTIIKIYDPERSGRALDGPTLARASGAVASLVDRGDLRAVYQPIVDPASGLVLGFEGLVRPVPGSGFDHPAALFAAAEAAGRAMELDRLCMETLVVGAASLAPDQTLSLNISPRTLEAPEFSAAWLRRILASGDLAAERVVLDVSEREQMSDVELVRRRLASCQAAGLRIAIDDVGTGNAGLRLLSQIQFDIVKIDLSLLKATAGREGSREILRSLVELAARWGATAVGEGVEAPADLRLVRELGLAEAQGYLLGRPGPLPDVRAVNIDRLLGEPDLRVILGKGGAAGEPAVAAAARSARTIAG
jgi:diguanylate cyclase (GGDEF)-like protein